MSARFSDINQICFVSAAVIVLLLRFAKFPQRLRVDFLNFLSPAFEQKWKDTFFVHHFLPLFVVIILLSFRTLLNIIIVGATADESHSRQQKEKMSMSLLIAIRNGREAHFPFIVRITMNTSANSSTERLAFYVSQQAKERKREKIHLKFKKFGTTDMVTVRKLRKENP